ncbi:hypothetical protein DUNSADRAFT_9469 [Dunaliella salina]|uniref:Encoded protein n=1 Tax=Dunaliella salina TaxID=3046 RepID=A0ABQ7GHG0_DUNSA|nr:hypothetical protein DUNSADRAFT_9469 [Dunaliella salina]|eukprot:KAF5834030.1 hypothetical protein DUNSADRAFT_9469 [Dunaliella salina]
MNMNKVRIAARMGPHKAVCNYMSRSFRGMKHTYSSPRLHRHPSKVGSLMFDLHSGRLSCWSAMLLVGQGEAEGRKCGIAALLVSQPLLPCGSLFVVPAAITHCVRQHGHASHDVPEVETCHWAWAQGPKQTTGTPVMNPSALRACGQNLGCLCMARRRRVNAGASEWQCAALSAFVLFVFGIMQVV